MKTQVYYKHSALADKIVKNIRCGIYTAGEKLPIQVLNVYLFTLPDADQMALQAGIRVYSSEALRSLIEDFTG